LLIVIFYCQLHPDNYRDSRHRLLLAHSTFRTLLGYQPVAKADADFGGQRYVKQAEFR